ncbi:NAD(P)H-hydrate dehydratase [Gallaecimonas sp. GXIMD1310]|uniref:NAD(P)H-hydrate dehydratase n=1 Tax=Gallaecimonas sp. GXIMD1310 TaxID=3131926 RepID=UPI0032546DA7
MLIPLLDSLPQPLPTASELKTLEVTLAKRHRLSLATLMERAGAAALAALQRRWPEARRLLVLAGKGNNGGDAYVLARLALEQGWEVTLVASAPPATQLAEAACQQFLAAGGVTHASIPVAIDAEVVVDGLLGAGVNRVLTGPVAPLQQWLANTSLPVLALDVPSGLGSDSGHWWAQPFQAAVVVTFIYPKAGLLTGQGRATWQQAYLAELGVADTQLLATRQARGWADLQYLRPQRLATVHKGHSGRVLLVGGNSGFSGAIRLAGEAALRTGAGLVSVQCHPQSQLAVAAGRPELMVKAVQQPQLPAHVDAVVLGPGLGRDAWARRAMLLASTTQPLVLDADALNQLPAGQYHNAVLTPHPGEAARLLGCSVADVEQDRFAAARTLSQRFGAVVVLKGAGSIVAAGAQSWLLAVGSEAMASGGMGDLLSGIIGALLAAGLPPQDAALLAVALHGEAGRLAGQDGVIGTLASDLLPWLRTLMND